MTLPRLLRRRSAATLLAVAAGLTGAAGAPAAAQSTPHQLTVVATRAGLQPGNATMGWSHQAATRSLAPVPPSAASTSAFTPTGVLGIDVASYQKNISWPTWAAAGRQFAYVKATEGAYYKNPYAAQQSGGAYAVGMMRGAYHFANPKSSSGKTQAGYFVKNGGAWTLDGRTLPGVLDIEYNPYGATCYGLSQANMVAWIAAFTTEYKRLTTRDAVIYTTADWWKRCTGNTTRFTTTNPLWAARYGTTTPGTLPGAWRTATFWQYTSTPLDQDRFSASFERLVVLANGFVAKG
ncbi:MAG: glycoside hydrolase family 25 [Friedmanniella sp.]|nr:glycoside hydrolase family 25 [Friedmanniella sp.]